MSGQFTKLVVLLALLLLAGCARTPYRLLLGATNKYPSLEGASTYCTDGLEASLELQGVKVETGLLAPDESKSIDLIVPEGAGSGTVLTTEARCYRDDQEVGYALVERPYRSPRIPTVGVIPPPNEGPFDFSICTELTEARGVPICVEGDPYD